MSDEHKLEWLIGIVEALRHDCAAGALTRVQQLIRAEVFDDFLDMSEHLLELGCKDPSAVIAGAVLEQHLRKLCIRVGLSIMVNGKPKKADAINSELAAQDVYGKLDQKSITSWLDLRNRAAHGEYSLYGPEQVRLLLQGVRDFVSRVPT
jgi:hypothetical protein